MTRPRLEWQARHGGKRKYRTRRQAWAVIARIWWREHRCDSLQPYACTWDDDWKLPRLAEPHIHIGHGKYSPQDRVRYWRKRLLTWPYYRLRRSARSWWRARRQPGSAG